ncbi:MAG: hypothetical protein EBU90_12560 [Proteobacteria bacterium]|jgi:hypothetical protein|nr:hypothetical protein [Pseudomonadota bacterium]NBP15157.1 hypothetical protein [bacterium]
MENPFHPSCECGEKVIVFEYQRPVYDDGGGLDSFEFEYYFEDVCGDCYIKRETRFVAQSLLDDDDLPF